MKKIKNIIFLIILLSLFVLAGCSMNEVKETSAQMEIEKQNDVPEQEIKNKEIEYIQVVLNSGWQEKQTKQNRLNDLAQVSNNANRMENDEEIKQQEEAKGVETEEQSTNTSNDEEEQEQAIDYPYYIKINYQANVLNIYTKDENGEYTVPYTAMLCSTGKATPRSGVYSIIYKYRWLEMLGGVYSQYCNQVVGNILIHSVPYLRCYDNGSLEYWEYDKLGTSASAGCIRLTVKNAKWIYENCPKGTPIEFYADSDPGPFGKPEEMKISSYAKYRNWDPTDPSEENPWNNYFQQTTGSIIE